MIISAAFIQLKLGISPLFMFQSLKKKLSLRVTGTKEYSNEKDDREGKMVNKEL